MKRLYCNNKYETKEIKEKEIKYWIEKHMEILVASKKRNGTEIIKNEIYIHSTRSIEKPGYYLKSEKNMSN